MKRLLTGLALLAALLTLGILGTRSLGKTAEQIPPLLEAAQSESVAGHSQEAAALAEAAQAIWQRRRNRMASLTDHKAMEQIDCGFAALTAPGAAGESEEFVRTCRELQVHIRSLWESERIRIHNLLSACGRSRSW